MSETRNISLKDAHDVCATMTDYGIDFTLRDARTFAHIKDQKFHQLRRNYIAATLEFEAFIGFEAYMNDERSMLAEAGDEAPIDAADVLSLEELEKASGFDVIGTSECGPKEE